jgi:CotS family spore coat protein
MKRGMRPTQEVRQLAGKHGIQVNRMEKIHSGVYRITTARGNQYCLKRMPYSPVRLRWIDKTLLRLKSNGLHRIVWRNPKERAGKRLFVRRFRTGPPFVLHPWVKGEWPSPKSSSQMKVCGVTLAKFHRKGKQILIPKAGRNNMMGKWHSYLWQEYQVLHKAVRKAERNGFGSPLDRMLKTHGGEILKMGKSALRALKQSDYVLLCRKTRATLCHGDGGPTNFIRTSKGMYLIDFETLRLDLRAYDLYRVIFNSCKDNGWNFAIIKSILDGYQSVNKLTSSDYRMLKVWLRFPMGICKHIYRYDQKTARGKLEIERDFPKVIAAEYRRIAALKKLDAYAKKS